MFRVLGVRFSVFGENLGIRELEIPKPVLAVSTITSGGQALASKEAHGTLELRGII